MPDVYQLAAQHRRELAAREAAATNQLLRGYGRAWNAVERDIQELTTAIAKANQEGRPSIVPPVMGRVTAEQLGGYSASKDWQLARLRAIQAQLASEINDVAWDADGIIRAEQAHAINAAQDHAREAMRQAVEDTTPGLTAGFTQANLAPLREAVGFLADGTPLNTLLAQLGPQAVTDMTTALTTGIALGHHPNRVARAMQASLGGNAARARTIARTEMLRSYREASRTVYEANDDVVGGWIWHSARGTTTCAACWAMHGTEHPVSESMGSHPNCRCSMVPRTRSWEELGFTGVPDTTPRTPLGTDDFRRLTDAQQKAVLGPGKFEAYKAGDIDLPDLVRTKTSSDWGTTRTVASLEQAKRVAKTRKAVEARRAPAPAPRPTPAPAPKPKSARLAYSEAQDARRDATPPSAPASNWRATIPTFWGSLKQKEVDRLSNGLDVAINRFPGLGRSLNYVGTFAGWNKEATRRKSPGGKGVMAVTTRPDSPGSPIGVLFVNKHVADLDDLRATMKRNHASGHFSTDHDHHVAVHEMGHVAVWAISDKMAPGMAVQTARLIHVHQKVDDVLRAHFAPDLDKAAWVRSAKRREVRASVSKYGNESTDELLAEVFAEYVLNPASTNETVRVIGGWMARELENL